MHTLRRAHIDYTKDLFRLKDNLHRALRDNNKRVLNLYDECRDGNLPSSFIESKTEESCARDAAIDAFQGTLLLFGV